MAAAFGGHAWARHLPGAGNCSVMISPTIPVMSSG